MKTPAEMLADLGKPFPPTAIKKRKGGGGKMYDYVETHAVIRRLNDVTGGEWSFIIRGYEWRGTLLMVHGELTIPPLGTRSAFGVQEVQERAGEDLVKGGASDALKKCATLFGVALDLYGPEYEANVSVQAPQRPAEPSKPANAGTDTPTPKDARTEALGRTLHGLAEHDFLHAVAVQWGFESFAHVPADNRERLLAYINGDGKGEPDKLQAFHRFRAKWEQDNKRAALKAQTNGLLPGVDAVPNPRANPHHA